MQRGMLYVVNWWKMDEPWTDWRGDALRYEMQDTISF